MNQQIGFNRNNRTGMGRNIRPNPEMNSNQNTIKCCVDRGTRICDIPINTYQQGTEDKYVYFCATVKIPKGFVLAGNDYVTRILLAGINLETIPLTQNCQCGDFSLCSTSKECVLLNGLIVYNVNLENFRAFCPVESVGVIPGTLFSGYGTVYVDRLLDCVASPASTACGNTDMRPIELNPFYRIVPEKCEEYLTTCDGCSIYRGRDAQEYYDVLNNPDIEKIIHIPYRLLIQSLRTEECNQTILQGAREYYGECKRELRYHVSGDESDYS